MNHFAQSLSWPPTKRKTINFVLASRVASLVNRMFHPKAAFGLFRFG